MGTDLDQAPEGPIGALAQSIDQEVARALMQAAPENTRRAYRAQVRMFVMWCWERGLESRPAAPETVARYLAERARAGAGPATLRASRAAVSALHRALGAENPCRTELVRLTLRGLVRGQGGRGPRQAKGLTTDGLAAIIATADRPRRTGRGVESEASAVARGAVDKAVAGVLFHAGLRRSEAAALQWEDVEPATTPGAVRVRVRRSKTDPLGEHVDVRMVKGAAAAALLALRPDPFPPGQRVFGLSGRTLARRLQAAARAAGLEGEYSGHSGRVGLASELTARGASVQEVMLAGGWRSGAMVARYSARTAVEQGAVAKYL